MAHLENFEPTWLRSGFQHIWLPYTQMQNSPLPIAVESAHGMHLTLADGRKLLDGTASWWTAAHGYTHPHIEEAVRKQLEKMPHVMFGGLAHEQAYKLAERLSAVLPGDLERVFFSESGSVAVEVAMKMAVQYWLNKGERRTRFLSFNGGYHGDTLSTMSVCDPDEGMHSMFRGVVAEQIITDLPIDEASLQAFTQLLEERAHEIAAVMIEPRVQGAGGMRFHDDIVLRKIRDLSDKYNVLLICDEIFVGFARIGDALFASEAAQIVPDIMTLSKALTGGTMPLAATVACTKVFEGFLSASAGDALMHGPTYMGNPLACAAANASLDLFEEEPRLAQAQKIGVTLKERLEPARDIAGVKDVRVQGAIGVIEVEQMRDLDWLKARFVEKGLWLRPFGQIIYTTPPLIASADEVAQIADTMVSITKEWAIYSG